MEYEILLVDDESDNVDALERLFRKSYKVHKATSGKQALKILKEHPQIALILSDQRMPEMTGVQLLKKSISSHPFALRILLTGYTDVESIVDSINSGEVYRYLTKPWDPVDLKNTIDKAIEKYSLRQELVDKNARLEQALSELQTLDQAKTNFMILINHELKTPLTVITSFLDLLKESKIDDEQKMYIDRIDKSRKRLQLLIDSSLELISAETGQVKIHKKNTSLSKLAEEIQMEFNTIPNSDKRNLKLEVEEAKTSLDPQIIKKVCFKLLENAVKFSPNDSEIKLQIFEENESFVFRISNKGPKMDKKTIQKILKPFSLDENIMNHTQGLGLGLSTCQALLKAQESELKISYESGWVTVEFAI